MMQKPIGIPHVVTDEMLHEAGLRRRDWAYDEAERLDAEMGQDGFDREAVRLALLKAYSDGMEKAATIADNWVRDFGKLKIAGPIPADVFAADAVREIALLIRMIAARKAKGD